MLGRRPVRRIARALPSSHSRTVAIPQSLSANPVHKFRRSFLSTGYTGNTAGDTGYQLGFSLGQVPNFTEFTSLFDMWRIVQVDFHMFPAINSGDLNGATTNIVGGLVAIAVDYDDATVPASFNQMLEKQDVQIYSPYEQVHLSFKPRTTAQLTSGGSLGTAMQGQWVDCANTSVVHYGIKFSIQDSANNFQIYTVVADCHFEFKDVR